VLYERRNLPGSAVIDRRYKWEANSFPFSSNFGPSAIANSAPCSGAL
jgi:hypothetical protein